jgi:hypothetical protein
MTNLVNKLIFPAEENKIVNETFYYEISYTRSVESILTSVPFGLVEITSLSSPSRILTHFIVPKNR